MELETVCRRTTAAFLSRNQSVHVEVKSGLVPWKKLLRPFVLNARFVQFRSNKAVVWLGEAANKIPNLTRFSPRSWIEFDRCIVLQSVAGDAGHSESIGGHRDQSEHRKMCRLKLDGWTIIAIYPNTLTHLGPPPRSFAVYPKWAP